MSEQSKVPTAAELREAAGWCEGEPMRAKLLAGAVAMERAERLTAALLWVQSGLRDGILVCRAYLGHNRSERAQDWFLELKAKIDAALAQEGGA